MPRILIIDDDETMCATLAKLVKRMGHSATCKTSCADGLAATTAEDFDVVFLDVRLPDGDGLDLLPKIEAAGSTPEVIIMTGFGDPNGAELAIKSGAWDYIEKTSSARDITLSLERALQYRLEKTAVAARHKISALKRDRIIGSSPQLKACLDQVAQAAGSDVNVFITGDTGTGKELFARAVHDNSHRARSNFIVVDCTALPETLVESLLFGHERGSFTGAEKARDGLVRQAHQGTLFLDEVGELPLELQKAFLRVLQERRFRPLGSNREIESDFRLVAATNRNLDQMVRNGRFREDLLYRLRSYLIELPPLRDRVEDIAILTRYHVDLFCERYNLSPKGFSPDFLEMLKAYAWPGNVRELVNTLERTLSSARLDPTLFPKHLPTHLRVQVTRANVEQESATESTAGRASPQNLPSLHEYRESTYNDAERQYLLDLMSLTDFHIAEACRLSELSQSRLYALLKKHEIPRSR